MFVLVSDLDLFLILIRMSWNEQPPQAEMAIIYTSNVGNFHKMLNKTVI